MQKQIRSLIFLHPVSLCSCYSIFDYELYHLDEGKLLFLLTKILKEIKYLRGTVVKMIEEEDQAKNMSRMNRFWAFST